MSNFLSNHNVRNRLKILAATSALTLGALTIANASEEPKDDVPCTPVIDANCPADDGPTLSKKGSNTTSTEAKPTTTLPEKLSAAESYVVSPERNQEIDTKVQQAGAQVVAAAESGAMGPFDFYNFQTNDWGRRYGNEGWGMLQHNPQYGGSEDQVSVMVYQDATGNVDLTKGVKSLMFRDPNGSVEFTAPGGVFSVFDPEGPKVHENSWSVRVATHEDIAAGDNVGTESSEFTAYDAEMIDLQMTDYTADSLLRVFIETHEL